MEQSFLDILNHRRSIRQYQKDISITQTEWLAMLNETMKAPSTFNMQPCRCVVLTNEKEKLKGLVETNTSQLNTCSSMLLLLGDLECFSFFDTIYQKEVDCHHMSKKQFLEKKKAYTQLYHTLSEESLRSIITFDGGLWSMQFMLVAKHHGYDTCAIGGFDKKNILKRLNINEKRYFPLLLFSIGKAAESPIQTHRLTAKECSVFR